MFNSSTMLYVELNAFALAILFLIYFNMRNRAERILLNFRLFMALLWTDAVILLLDSAMWLLDGRTGFLLRPAYYTVTAAYYILNPFIGMLWSLYADYQVYALKSRLIRRLVPMAIPVCVNAVLSVLSVFDGAGNGMFTIDENNVYHRENLFWLMAVISFLYLVYSMIFIIVNRRKLSKRHYYALLFYSVPPTVGGILQSLFYGLSAIWICTTLSVLVVFMYIQNDSLDTDYLTGLFNRRQLDAYMRERDRADSSKTIAGIMMDFDFFKMINDRYGHLAGDEALEYTAAILRKAFGSDDFIARYGGDEFIVFFEIKSPSDLDAAIKNLKETVDKFNNQKLAPYTISLCMGYDVYDRASGVTFKEFINHIDKLMYEKKSGRKAL